MAPSSASPPTSWPKEKQDSLNHLSSILHLIHHRNKNQHRRSHWYRHFDIFRRHLNTLCAQIATLNHTPTTNLERTRKRALDKDLQFKVQQRLDAWQEVYVAKWQHAFSQLVADGRFAVVGLALLGALAEACELTGVTMQLEEVGEREVQKALREFGEVWQGGESDLPIVVPREEGENGAGDDDVGVVVERQPSPSSEKGVGRKAVADIDAPRVKPPAPILQASENKLARSNTPEDLKPINKRKRKPEISNHAPKKNKKKGKSSLDDLFKGLV